MNCGLTGDFIS